jgi:uncharacterized Tic20 family protein
VPGEFDELELKRRGQSGLEKLIPIIGTVVVILALLAALFAWILYEVPCIDDCSKRTSLNGAQLTVALVALIPVALTVAGLAFKKKLLLAIAITLTIAAYVTWAVLIIDMHG